MIKTLIFDLDGVLVDTKDFHFKALNMALERFYPDAIITKEEHHKSYDGLKTMQKLARLTREKGLPEDLHNNIWAYKQAYTENILTDAIKVDERLVEMFKELCGKYFIACCSNSIKNTTEFILESLGIREYFNTVVTNEDVPFQPKPHPAMYWRAMEHTGAFPDQTIIFEDSPVGLMAAHNSCAMVYRIRNPKDLTLELIHNVIDSMNNDGELTNPKWQDKNLNVLIPMAGNGSRFRDAGYTFPKPLIEVNGKPMIQVVTENLNVDASFKYIVQKEHNDQYNLESMLKLITPNCQIFITNGITDGAACTTLLADGIDNEHPLLIANSDQFLFWNSNEFFYKMQEQNCDGGIVTFTATHPKWSFAKVDEYGYVTEVAEKNPISNEATCGVYYWKHGSDYVKYAKRMIAKDIRTNNEFYVCPVFNEAIQDGKKIKAFHIDEFYGIGTPEDLQTFLNIRR